MRRGAGIDDVSPLKSIMMSWDQVREMHRAGMICGPHAHAPEPAQRDARGGRARDRRLRDAPGRADRVRVLHRYRIRTGRGSAHLTESVKNIVRRADFVSATTSVTGSVMVVTTPSRSRIGIYNRHGAMPEFTLDIEREDRKRDRPSIPFGGATRRDDPGVEKFPGWAILLTVVAGLGLGVAAMFSDASVGIGTALVGIVFAALLVLYRPHIGVIVIMSTMLMSYPPSCAA